MMVLMHHCVKQDQMVERAMLEWLSYGDGCSPEVENVTWI